ncbi:HD domain-containing protein [Arthrobacter sp. SLBN-83]|uniref:HD domain-containing protein n=1 Tax=Arthrobacter sp. SLBN-83 TaxID=2768449 RepID=UPI00114F38CE|nr:HD domain-containing protein [Arthrobacter sp. SLBN-83]TQJ61446.1 HD domain-containing protein [Arthrobacter sp. SLBN-83]
MNNEGVVLAAAEDLLVRLLQPPIFNHSARVFEYARAIAAAEGCAIDVAALRLASLFHDAGTADEYDGPQRFEVEGADAAAAFLTTHGWEATRVDSVWEAIALHTSPQIAERRGPVARYLRLGVRADFGDDSLLPRAEKHRSEVEATYPRLMIEQCLGQRVVGQALRNPEKAPPSSWPGGLLQAHLGSSHGQGINPAF